MMVKIEPKLEPFLLSSNIKTSIELIRPDENQKLQYQGYCKIEINKPSEFLFVKPMNENFMDITAVFKWKFIRQKNILFVFGEFNFQDFALVFTDHVRCRKVYNGIFKERSKDFVNRKLLFQHFLDPIFQAISQNDNFSRLKELMEEWIQKHEGKEKQKFLQLLKKYQSNPGLEDIDELNVKQESDDGPNVSRKRKHCETESIVDNADKDIVLSDVTQPNMNDGQNFDTDVSVEIPSKKQQLMFSTEQCRKVIDKSCFKIVNYKQKNGIYRKLLVFAKSEPSYCYEYNWNGRKKYFNHRCNKHPNGHKAILALDEEGNEYVKLEDKPQKCAPILYDPKRYNEVKITKKSNYEILENCKTKSKRILIIFDSNDKTQCYEYYLTSQNKFECCGCAVKKKHLVAEIYYENTENEYIRLQNAQHV